jgi:hypothetical protein
MAIRAVNDPHAGGGMTEPLAKFQPAKSGSKKQRCARLAA